jgi:zinc protease
MMRPLGVMLALAAMPLWAAAAQFPPNPPAPATRQAPAYPPAQEVVLPNGLRLVVMENHREPLISIALTLPAGTAYDATGKEGTAELVTALLTRGAGSRSAEQVADLVERIGGSVSAVANPDHLTIQADVLADHADTMLALLADLVLRPKLDSADIEAQRQQELGALQNELSAPGAVATRIFLAALYGSHPYGRRPTPESVQSLRRADLEAFCRARFRPAGSLLVVTGDMTLAAARQLATRSLGAWSGTRPAVVPSPPRTIGRTVILLVHSPGASRANILVGNTTAPGADTSVYASLVATRILGDEDDGRLVRYFARQRRWTDVAFASLARTEQLGMFQVGVEAGVQVTDSAVADLLAMLRGMRRDLVPARELDEIKHHIVDDYPFTLQTASQFASSLTEARRLGLPGSFLATFRSRIASISPTRLREASRRLLKPDSALVVILGDGARLYRPLSALAPVRLVALDGTPLKPEDIQPKPAPFELETAGLAPRHDSLLVLAQGRVVGRQVYSLEPSGSGFTYLEHTEIAQIVNQDTRLELDSLGHMRRLNQTGRIQGQDTKIELAYGDGRVRGSSRIASPQGPRTLAIDTSVAANILDDNALQALLPSLKWAPNVRWSFDVFSGGDNQIKTLTLSVVSVEQVPVGNRTVAAYRAVLEGGGPQVTFFVATAPPHRLVRVILSNAPIEFVAQ